MPHDEFPLEPSTLEIIDQALYNWVDAELDVSATTNKGWKKVSTIWVTAERAYHTKRDKELRNTAGAVVLPIITIERVSATKDPASIPFGNLFPIQDEKGGSSFSIKRVVKQDKTANFKNADSRKKTGQNFFPYKAPKILFSDGVPVRDKTVYEVYTIPQPVFMNISYRIGIRAEYQQQMNEIITPFMRRTGNIRHFYISEGTHSYEAFVENDFGYENNISNLGEEERRYESSVSVTVLGYLIGDGKNSEQPKVVKRESAAQIKFNRERTVVGDINDFIGDGFYRE